MSLSRAWSKGGGGEEAAALAQFSEYAPQYEIGDPVEFVVAEAARLRRLYPLLMVAPLMYAVENDRLLQIARGISGSDSEFL